MVFVPPSWIEGFLVQFVLYIIIPLFFASILGLTARALVKEEGAGPVTFVFTFMVILAIMVPVTSVIWHDNYEKPSVNEKIITVKEWQPKAGIQTNSNGMMIIDNADQLMLITTEDEGFLNMENFFFQKFDTRDVLNDLKVNGTYKIKYYGWRNGFNSGFPNILSVEEVIDESTATNKSASEYFGTKLV